jgi:hypothetical protein
VKAKDIMGLLKDGKKPLVKVTGALWDDAWSEAGMLARIVAFKEDTHDEEMVEFTFNYNEHKAHNLALQGHTYYLNSVNEPRKLGTAIEAGLMKEEDLHEEVHFMLEGNGSDVPVELADSPILAEYAKSGSKLSYVGWLEDFIETNVPNCMKPWAPL